MAAVVAGKVRRQRRADENAFKVLNKMEVHTLVNKLQDAMPFQKVVI